MEITHRWFDGIINSFNFGGEPSYNYGIVIEAPPQISGAERDVEEVSIPGRDGSLLIDKGYFKNVTVSYDTWSYMPPANNYINPHVCKYSSQYAWAHSIKGWLQSQPGVYRPLWDTYDTLFVRYGRFKGEFNANAEANTILKQTLSFDCKPFAYSIRGMEPQTVQSGTVLNNPFPFTAKPLIEILGNGTATLEVGDRSWTIAVDGNATIDSERMQIYKGTQNLSGSKHGDGYPELPPGDCGIRYSGCDNVMITPRWCTL